MFRTLCLEVVPVVQYDWMEGMTAAKALALTKGEERIILKTFHNGDVLVEVRLVAVNGPGRCKAFVDIRKIRCSPTDPLL